MGFTSSAFTAIHTAVPAATLPIIDQVTTMFTDFGSFLKVGAPTVAGVVVLIWGIREGFKLTKMLMLAAAAAFVIYLSIGGGISDISNGFKIKAPAAAAMVVEPLVTSGLLEEHGHG